MIKKPWCTYGWGYAWGYGKIVDEDKNCVDIRYSEGQMYPPECWHKGPNYVKRFNTLEEAALQYQTDVHNHTTGIITTEDLNDDMRYKFPSYFKKKKIPNFYDKKPNFYDNSPKDIKENADRFVQDLKNNTDKFVQKFKDRKFKSHPAKF
jgi:hypothetical protein